MQNESKTVLLSVQGMTCSGCARRVSEALQGVPGVAGATVDLENARARVRWSASPLGDGRSLTEAVQKAGFTAALLPQDAAGADGSGRSVWSPTSGWQFNVVFGSIITAALILAEWVFQLGLAGWYRWTAFVLVLPVQVFCGARFYRGAWNQLKVGSSNMDTLVALGSTTAFAYSVWGLFAGWPGHLYFMESAAILSLISVGHWLEAKASARAETSLRSLLELAPATARKLDETGRETEVPVEHLRPGDEIVLKPGDRVPTDGAILDGESAVDESMLTGESVPTDKTSGDKVFTGTVNQNGRLRIRVEAVGEETALSSIIAVVERAQSSRADIQRLGDRVSSVFVPIVVLVALATALGWGLAPEFMAAVTHRIAPFLWMPHLPEGALASAVYHAAAVLIIACPCAMGLATPVAIMAGTNAAARRGILIRDGLALEKSGRLTAVVFDKTGTLTEGKVALADSKAFTDGNERTGSPSVAMLAASLAQPSNHPVSRAVAAGSKDPLPVSNWQEHRGAGVEGTIDSGSGNASRRFRLGSLHWLRECGVDLTPGNPFVEEWSAKGASVLGLATDNRLLGLLAVRDNVKARAADVVSRLHAQGKTTYLITGDNRLTAHAIARQAGIPDDHVFAEVRPERKAEIVADLQRRGGKIAFVGDGINDAPALEQADLGIAVGKASDVAREAADIILLNSDIQAIPEALGLAQATLRTIKQNLFWAFFYNAAGIPLAMFGFLSPVFSAVAMGLSDLIVIGNALRLGRWRIKE